MLPKVKFAEMESRHRRAGGGLIFLVLCGPKAAATIANKHKFLQANILYRLNDNCNKTTTKNTFKSRTYSSKHYLSALHNQKNTEPLRLGACSYALSV